MAQRKDARELNFIQGLKDGLMKTYSEYINDGVDNRVGLVYEAYSDTKDGQECVCTVYVYHGSTDDIKYTREIASEWKGEWDAEIEASTQWANINGREV